MGEMIQIKAVVAKPVELVWEAFFGPEHIVKWNQASEDWHTVRAEGDLRPGGTFSSRMEAKDGSMGFDFGGTYDLVEQFSRVEYTLGDGRVVKIHFTDLGDSTDIEEWFEAEGQNPAEMQQQGWQSILNSFKKYTESLD